ncbi:lamin tail domain-containing protein [Streptomyces fructofermentans]|uniref:lamin tail domain-containing protein n=1 Tax=Streptomyces fructofermentans TaxID=152141 RepID=UPI003F4D659B
MSSRSIRRSVAVVLAAGAALGSAALPANAAPDGPGRDRDRSRVVISAVQYDSPGRDDRSNRSLNGEWVQITNRGRHDVNLSGWKLSDRDGRTYTFRHFSLDGRSSVRVHTGIGRDTHRDVFQDRRNYVWDDSDTATLTDRRGRFVDNESWGHRHVRPGHDRPGHDRPGHDRPGQHRPGHDRPGHDRPGQHRPGHDRPGHDRPGHDRPGQHRPGHDRPGHDRPGHDRPGQQRPGQDRPGNDRPGQDRPGNDRPGNDRPGQDRPGNDRPGNDRPGNDRPGNDRPGQDRPGQDRNNRP